MDRSRAGRIPDGFQPPPINASSVSLNAEGERELHLDAIINTSIGNNDLGEILLGGELGGVDCGEGLSGVSQPREMGTTIFSGTPVRTLDSDVSLLGARQEGPHSRGGLPSGPPTSRENVAVAGVTTTPANLGSLDASKFPAGTPYEDSLGDTISPITPVSTAITGGGGLSQKIKNMFGSKTSLNDDASPLPPLPKQKLIFDPADQDLASPPKISSGDYDPSQSDGFAASTPFKTIQLSNGSKVNTKGIYQTENSKGFELKPFRNRASKFFLWSGFTSENSCQYNDFDSPDSERINFLHSSLGDIASPIDENMNFFIFGVKNYIKVTPCQTCRRGKSCHPHHLQAILEDVESNKNFVGEITIKDVDVKREFSLVTVQMLPVFNSRAITVRRPLPVPNLIIVPNKDLPSAPLAICEVNLDQNLIERLNSLYFPNHEIIGDFEFRI